MGANESRNMATEIIIHDGNYQDHLDYVCPDTGPKSKGLVSRNFSTHPVGCYACAKPFDLPLIPESEWQSRLDALIAAKAQLSDVRMTAGPNGGMIPSRDQDSYGYCWAHSSTSAALYVRAVNNQPYADLSAFAVAAIIKNWRDEGGWGAESLEFIAQRGIPTSEFWPQQSMNRSNDNPNTWNNAALHKFTEWMDLDPNNVKAQLVTALLMGMPVVVDYDWWSHSVCAIDLVSLNPFRIRIQNSWGDGWSDRGMGILEGSKAIPDSALAARVMTASNEIKVAV